MEIRKLGSQGLTASRMGLGCMGMSEFYGERNDEESIRVLQHAAEYVQSSCEGSLKRLDTEVIDLYYLHRKDPGTAIEETVGAMSRLIEQGKIKGIGLSEVSAATLRKAHKVHPITAVQSEYSLWSREPEEEILQTCKELDIAFVAYSPLGVVF